MPEGAIIIDRAYFSKPEWLNQARNGGFSRGMAWLDLLALTNQCPTTASVRGIQMALERGECAYSKLGLAERWGRSQNWVSATLAAWEADGRLQIRKSDNETTILFVANFDSWQLGMWHTLKEQYGEQKESKSRASGEQKETEKEKERDKEVLRREGEGGGSAPLRSIPFETAWKYFRENGSGYTEDQVREQWLYYDAMRHPVTGDWQRPVGRLGVMTPISDWRSELCRALTRFATGEPGGVSEKNGGGVSPSVAAIQTQQVLRSKREELAALEEEVHADRIGNLQVGAEKKSRLKHLRGEVAELERKAA